MRFVIVDASGGCADYSGSKKGLAALATEGVYPCGLDVPAADLVFADGTFRELTEAEKTAREGALKPQVRQLIAALVTELNAKYPALNLASTDTPQDAAAKMLAAGVAWADVDTYGGRLNLLSQIGG